MLVVFGFEHMVYSVVSIGLLSRLVWVFLKLAKTPKQQAYGFKIAGLLLLAAIVFNRLSIVLMGGHVSKIFPGTFCGLNALLLSIGLLVFKRNHAFFHCVAFIGFLGGLITVVYPDFINQSTSIFYPKTISGLMHHSLIVFIVIAMVKSGYVVPSIKKWHYMVIGLSFYMNYGLFLITMLGYDDAMIIFNPILSNTPLNWLVMGVIVLVLVLHGLFLMIYGYFQHTFKQKPALLLV